MFNFIVNPTTNNKVRVNSNLGQLIIKNYAQLGGGVSSVLEEPTQTNNQKRQTIIKLMDDDWKEYFDEAVPDYNYTIFFENDKVKVDPAVAFYADASDDSTMPNEFKKNNSVGRIVDPRKVAFNDDLLVFRYLHPEDLIDHSEINKGPFSYTSKSGAVIQDINMSYTIHGNIEHLLAGEIEEDVISYIRSMPPGGFELNKTTSHKDDVSFLKRKRGIEPDYEKNYLVEWNGAEGQYLSMMPVSHLLHNTLELEDESRGSTEDDDEEDEFIYLDTEEDEEGDEDEEEEEERSTIDDRIIDAFSGLTDSYNVTQQQRDHSSILKDLEIRPSFYTRNITFTNWISKLKAHLQEKIIAHAHAAGVHASMEDEQIISFDNWVEMSEFFYYQDDMDFELKDYPPYLVDADFLTLLEELQVSIIEDNRLRTGGIRSYEKLNNFFQQTIYRNEYLNDIRDYMKEWIETTTSLGPDLESESDEVEPDDLDIIF